ncbi:serine protease [Motilibacter deserti]|uniref:Serine protease n=1 Tax=Motilibacter deserti TaxID=2714956 RepID=A0ABX0GX77_9ACTN|nr:serine protease [Motilibacter deserti]NHC15582.1 trypsin-like peptidase domain-containing protein [Motilibacter deserti]
MAALDATVEALTRAARAGSVGLVEEACAGLSRRLLAGQVPLAQLREALDVLRDGGFFGPLGRVSESALQSGLSLPFVRLRHVQGLIELGHLTPALALLHQLEQEEPGFAPAEVRGLQGRAHKQMFLRSAEAGRREEHLAAALSRYAAVPADDPSSLWHRLNVCALLARAASEGLQPGGVVDPASAARRLAAGIVDEVEARRDTPDTWDGPALVEAALALRDRGILRTALRRLADDGGVTAFQAQSLRRQLLELWNCGPYAELVQSVVPAVSALALGTDGGRLDIGTGELPLTAGDQERAGWGYEAVFGSDGIQKRTWFLQLLNRCRSVALLADREEDGVGSGFLVEGTALHPGLPPVVVLTNAHVVPGAISEQHVRVGLRGLEPPVTGIRVGKVLWSSSPQDLDVAVLEPERVPDGVEALPVASTLPALGTASPSRVYVIGHPLALPAVRVSIQDNALLDYDDTRLHYRAPTRPGSSGSPVFDKDWDVIGVHRGGGHAVPRLHGFGTHEANEGTRIDAIRRRLAEELGPG